MDRICFLGAGLDRAAHLRATPDPLWAEPQARVLPLWRGKPLVQGQDPAALAWLPTDQPGLEAAEAPPIFLGLADGAPRFAIDLSVWEPAEGLPDTLGGFFDPSEQIHPQMPAGCRFAELRKVMTGLAPLDAELVAMARGLFAWHETHGFCAKCGAPSAVAEAGWQRRCDACGASHFPRTDPVVIMLITRGNHVLLGRSPGWPEGMFSLLAGFVEPGETPEAAVRREVLEEAGIRVGAVRYLASQPWPFPSSLMMAWEGEALSDQITLDPAELEQALWVSREDLARAFRGEHPSLWAPRGGAIARAVLSAWLGDDLQQLMVDEVIPCV